jgi:murein DD-endopeptidase MepM/ murein hydrolase activator NlpD
MAKAKSIHITWRHLLLATAGFWLLVVSLSSLFSYVTVRHAADIKLPFLQDLIRATTAAENERSKEFLRDNLNAMAVKLGQMQAQLIRIDSLGERLATLSGLKPEPRPLPKDGRGGPLIRPMPLSSAELQSALDALSREVESRGDTLSLLESKLLDERVRKSMLPTTLPVTAQWNASGFGWRIDPFTGERALHEGVDFSALVGTSVVAAASGVVISAEAHPEYGTMIEIDHGNGLSTRYAHTSKLFVKIGMLVRRGQKIAEVGNTGRTTGPHLHFEVRQNGVALNPNRFLRDAQGSTSLARR